MRRRRWAAVFLLAIVVVALAGCSNSRTTSGSTPSVSSTATEAAAAAGAGDSVADRVYRAAGLRMGEVLIYMAKEGPESRSASTRVMRAAASKPEWTPVGDRPITKRGDQQVFSYTFGDGSSLQLVGRGVLQSVEVIRP